jgi:hypothetical protein
VNIALRDLRVGCGEFFEWHYSPQRRRERGDRAEKANSLWRVLADYEF